jgi:hypothetical protein
MLYFHPWEFDPGQARLPLGQLSRFRTYVGLSKSRERFVKLLSRHRFARAVDVAKQLDQQRNCLVRYDLASQFSRPMETNGKPQANGDYSGISTTRVLT